VAERTLTLGEAATALGVSADTLRRWDRAGRLTTVRDARNRRLVPRREVERLSARPRRHATGGSLSARNRFAWRRDRSS
jgi:excisionase family DNA binding protein